MLAVLLLAASALPLRAAGLSGSYEGIGAGAGMSLVLNETGERIEGAFRPRQGLEYRLSGERSAKGAEGSLIIGGKASAAFFHLEKRPLGVQFLFIPSNAKGLPDIASAREYSFLNEDARKASSPDYRPAPQAPVDVVRFVDRYTEWSPRDVARQYAALPDDMRALILLYDYASVDVIWRICRSGPPNDVFPQAALNELLDRQTADCREILRLVKDVQDKKHFGEFLRRAKFEMQLVRSTVQCARGRMTQARCADVSAIGGPLILRWQDATVLLGGAARGEAAATAPPADLPPDMSADTSVGTEEVRGQAPVPLSRPSLSGVESSGSVPPADRPDGAGSVHDQPANDREAETPGADMRTTLSAPLPLARPRR
ncbi:MAG: hypothetical protein ABJJ29_14135 [Nitratireductor sp.]